MENADRWKDAVELNKCIQHGAVIVKWEWLVLETTLLKETYYNNVHKH